MAPVDSHGGAVPGRTLAGGEPRAGVGGIVREIGDAARSRRGRGAGGARSRAAAHPAEEPEPEGVDDRGQEASRPNQAGATEAGELRIPNGGGPSLAHKRASYSNSTASPTDRRSIFVSWMRSRHTPARLKRIEIGRGQAEHGANRLRAASRPASGEHRTGFEAAQIVGVADLMRRR
jgi:hypothetical protein